jgi:hypothetical protein
MPDPREEMQKITNAEQREWLRQASKRQPALGPALKLNSSRRRFEQEGPISLGAGSIEMRLTFCWVHANVRSDRLDVVNAELETARMRILEEELGRIEAAERWPVPDPLRPYVDTRADETFDQRLARLCELAGCVDREAEVLRESLTFAVEKLPGERVLIRPREIEEVARAMAPTQRRGMAPAITSVERWLVDGRMKLRRLFEVPKEAESDD